MRSDRLARLLLRLYPRAWRARYGDEFLAFVEDSGLSWRGVADVVAAAGLERVRSLVSVMRDEGDHPGVVIYFWWDLRDRAYCFYRALSFGSRWQGVSGRELAVWRVATFLMVILLLLAESDPRITWTCAMILWMAFRPPYFLTPAALARRRADYQRVFGSQGMPSA